MANSRELVLRLVSDASQFGRGFGQAERKASSFARNISTAFGGSAKDIDSRAKAIDASMRSAATAFGVFAAGATATVLAVRRLATFANDAVQEFAELTDSANAVNVVFGDAAGIVERFGQTTAESVGLARSEFNQLAAVVGSQLQTFGLSARDAAQEATRLTERAADLASVFGGSVNDALGAISAALRGERDPIERYGISLNEANVAAKALALGLADSRAELEASDKAAASLALIYEQSAQVSGDFANTADDLQNRQRTLNARWQDAQAVLGEQLEPGMQALLDVAENTIPVIEDLAPLFNQLAVAVADVADGSQGPIVELLEFFADVPRSIGIINDAVGVFGDTINSILVDFDFDDVRQGLDDIGQARIEQGLVDGIREGRDEVEVFTNALFQLSQQQALTADDIERFGRLAGLSDFEVGRGVTTLLDAFDAGTIELDRQALINLNRALTDVRNNLENVDTVTVEDIRFGNLREQAEQIGQDIADGLEEAQALAQEAADNLADAINDAAGDFASAISLFAEAPADLESIDLDQALSNIETQIERIQRFNDALSTLSSAGLDNLVADLAAQGPDAVLTAEALVDDIGAAFDLERALQEGNETALDAAVTAVLGQRETYRDDLETLGEFFAQDIENGFSSLDFTVGVTRAINAARAAAGGFTSGLSGPSSTATSLGAREFGGPVDAGKPYIVGERNPEIFVPNVAGRILPDLSGLGGSTTVNFNPTVYGSGNVGRDLDIQRHLLLASVGRMVES